MPCALLPSPDAARKIVSDNRPEDMPPSARDGPLSCSSPLAVQTYCDASFAPGGGRSRSGILVLLVDQKTIGHQPYFGSQEDKP